MKRTLTIVEDGTPVAAAVATWLERKVGPGARVAALRPSDVDRVVAARREAKLSERLLALTSHAVSDGALDGSAAVALAGRWLADLDPFAARALGPEQIERHVAKGGEDAAPFLRLLQIATADALPSSTAGRRRRGRPPGSKKHFGGVELDLAIALLVEPARAWSERELAEVTGRSPYGVHRALEALRERGYLDRERAQTRPRDPEVLRDDLARAWIAANRTRGARWFLAPRPRDVLDDTRSAAARQGSAIVLAGASAAEGLVSGSTIVYAATDVSRALAEDGFVASGVGRGQLVVWSPPSAMVFYQSRELGGRAATNRVVTFLDLMAADTERYAAVARTLWAET